MQPSAVFCYAPNRWPKSTFYISSFGIREAPPRHDTDGPRQSTSLYCTVLYCTVLDCTVCCCTVLYCIILYCTVQYCAVLYCTVMYCNVLYCTLLWCTVLYCAINLSSSDRCLCGLVDDNKHFFKFCWKGNYDVQNPFNPTKLSFFTSFQTIFFVA